MNKFWVNDDFFIQADDKGYTTESETFEGSLGYVIQLHHRNNEDNAKVEGQTIPPIHRALKIPKLVGATHRENAYFIELMDQETRIAFLASNQNNASGILRYFDRRVDFLKPNTLEQKPAPFNKESVILLNFEPGRLPRFCRLFVDGTIFPEAIKDFQDTVENKKIFSLLKEQWELWQRNIDKVETVYFIDGTINANDSNITIGNQNELKKFSILSKTDASHYDLIQSTWYAYLPTATYQWANGSLQEAVSLNQRNNWKLADHLEFFLEICNGIQTLHKAGFIHGDLRPANIMFLEFANRSEDYRISDYGSFATMYANAPIIPLRNSPQNSSVLQSEHTSIFYPPERGHGQERETANKAIVLKHVEGLDDDLIYIALGWKNDPDLNHDNFKQVLLDMVAEEEEETDASLSLEDEQPIQEAVIDNGLIRNDQIRIQNYVFRLEKPSIVSGNIIIFFCMKREVKRIHQKHIAINLEEKVKDDLPDIITVDRVVEIKQWSAATDIYSIGVNVLYSLFRASKKTNGEGKSNLRQQKEEENTIEDKFAEMLTVLASPSYFRIIWPDIDSICIEIQAHLDRKDRRLDFSQVDFEYAKYYLGGVKSDSNSRQVKETIRERCVEVTNRITVTVPEAKKLVEVLEYNLGAFLFLIRFVLACLHRKSHLVYLDPNQLNYRNLSQDMPFCENRTDPPRYDAGDVEKVPVIAKVLSEMGRIQANVENEVLFNMLKLTAENEKSKIVSYDNRPNVQVREDLNLLKDEMSSAFAYMDSYMSANFVWKPENLKIVHKILNEALQKRSDDTIFEDTESA